MRFTLPSLLIAAALPLLWSSCSERKITTQVESKRSGDLMERRLDESFKLQRGDDGSIQMQSDKRSSFEGARFAGSIGGFERKSFEKKTFDGSRSYDKKAWGDGKNYSGDLDTPDFVKHQSAVERSSSQLADRDFARTVSPDQGRTVLNTTDRHIERTQDEYTIRQNDQLVRPRIISSRDHQMESVEEVRAMMGRN